MKNRTMVDYVDRVHEENERLRWENREMRDALTKAVLMYGRPGGPWNVPSEPGTWLGMAKQALGVKE
jgi:hypothetical protein